MAQIDFTNATLDAYIGNPLTQGSYMRVNSSASLFDSSGNIISTGGIKTIILNTPAKVSIQYTGSMTASGTSFLIGVSTSGGSINFAWKVSNVSFSSGDTYDFIVDIETSGVS